MTKTYRIGVAGLTHDHVWGNLADLAASERGSWRPSPIRTAALDRARGLGRSMPITGNGRPRVAERCTFCDNAQGAEVGAGPPGKTACWSKTDGGHTGGRALVAAARETGVR